MRVLILATAIGFAAAGASARADVSSSPPVQPVLSEVQQPSAPAQTTPGKEAASPGTSALAPNEPDRAKRLDALFAALKAAPSKESAKAIADRIEVALVPSDSDTADLLMSRAATATQAKDYDLAIALLDGVLTIAPNHLDAWNRRATVFYLKEDFVDSLADLRQVVAREPRHYGAWAGIALICKELGDEKHALEAARMALAVYPQLESMKDMEKELAIKVEGRPI
ncbi:tetratricopeptide repeat protein [Ancylobacter lacus]|uniref:tetratricopeptide repeat protein n=1 Tax=Ancylobacter lacus TaxID=2579970 RepID=UPI001BCFD010|nr:tetratricopeptide repeat protein [Ancylobacter lacus]MBS7541470.1 tetratricopeptide repeat protein [Ancylobacter lacus]